MERSQRALEVCALICWFNMRFRQNTVDLGEPNSQITGSIVISMVSPGGSKGAEV